MVGQNPFLAVFKGKNLGVGWKCQVSSQDFPKSSGFIIITTWGRRLQWWHYRVIHFLQCLLRPWLGDEVKFRDVGLQCLRTSHESDRAIFAFDASLLRSMGCQSCQRCHVEASFWWPHCLLSCFHQEINHWGAFRFFFPFYPCLQTFLRGRWRGKSSWINIISLVGFAAILSNYACCFPDHIVSICMKGLSLTSSSKLNNSP